MFDPKGAVPDDKEYLQIVRSGIVSLPEEFPVGFSETFGNLEVFTPPLALVAALKLARGSESDLHDATWIVQNKLASVDEIRDWSGKIPDRGLSETAVENVVILEVTLVAPEGDTSWEPQ